MDFWRNGAKDLKRDVKAIKQVVTNNSEPSLQVVILAGGLSSRMGREKARLKLGRRTLLGHVRHTAGLLGFPVNVIRHDLVPQCGPMGGIYTGFKKYESDALLFLACDMPFVSEKLLEKIVRRFAETKRPLFTKTESAGFPFILPQAAFLLVEQQIAAQHFSLHALSQKLKAQVFRPIRREMAQLCNVNTREDWEKAKSHWSSRKKAFRKTRAKKSVL